MRNSPFLAAVLLFGTALSTPALADSVSTSEPGPELATEPNMGMEATVEETTPSVGNVQDVMPTPVTPNADEADQTPLSVPQDDDEGTGEQGMEKQH